MISKIVLAAGLALVSTDVQTSAPSLADKLKTELGCMAANLYFEARGEPLKGQLAVAKVTLNRVKSKQYPDSICAVVFQKSQFSWVAQEGWGKISTALSGLPPCTNKLEVNAWEFAMNVAEKALKQGIPGVLPEDVLHYHHIKIKPKWSSKMKTHKIIGNHVFMRKI